MRRSPRNSSAFPACASTGTPTWCSSRTSAASPADVLRLLQARNVRYRRGGGTIYPEHVHRMLTRVLYTGYLKCPAWDIPLTKAQHEPLISLDTFSRIQERLAGKHEVVHDRR